LDREYGYVIILWVMIFIFLALGTPRAWAAPAGSTVLQEGSCGPEVAALQMRLANLGYDVGPPDGIFSRRTRDAIRRFQADFGLPVRGLADATTLRAIAAEHDGTYGPLHVVREGDTLASVARQYGTQSETVRWLNQLRDTALRPGQILRLPYWCRLQPQVDLPATEASGGTASQPPSSGTEEDVPGAGSRSGIHLKATIPVPEPARSRTVRDDFVVLGYYSEDWEGDWRSLSSLIRSGGVVDLVVNFQMAVDQNGNIITRAYPELMAEARDRGLPVQGLLHNWSGDNFSPEIARAVVSDPVVRDRTIANVIAVARQQGLSGINVDLERIPPDQRENYTAFVRLLYNAAKAEGLQLTLSVPGKTYDDTTSIWEGAFDYRALGAYADYVAVMAYDEHLPGLPAGPVASYGWVRQVAQYAASQIPPHKVLLGLGAYGYEWIQGTTQGRALSASGAMALAEEYGAAVQWDAEAQVPYFTYVRDGVPRIVYYEDARSTAVKLSLVRDYGLGGVAIWRLGLEDPAIWSVLGP